MQGTWPCRGNTRSSHESDAQNEPCSTESLISKTRRILTSNWHSSEFLPKGAEAYCLGKLARMQTNLMRYLFGICRLKVEEKQRRIRPELCWKPGSLDDEGKMYASLKSFRLRDNIQGCNLQVWSQLDLCCLHAFPDELRYESRNHIFRLIIWCNHYTKELRRTKRANNNIIYLLYWLVAFKLTLLLSCIEGRQNSFFACTAQLYMELEPQTKANEKNMSVAYIYPFYWSAPELNIGKNDLDKTDQNIVLTTYGTVRTKHSNMDSF